MSLLSVLIEYGGPQVSHAAKSSPVAVSSGPYIIHSLAGVLQHLLRTFPYQDHAQLGETAEKRGWSNNLPHTLLL